MNKNIINRVLKESKYIIDKDKTIREIASIFKVSKSTVHKDLNERLKLLDKNIYLDVKQIFNKHIDSRHIKGGESTKKKYLEKNIYI